MGNKLVENWKDKTILPQIIIIFNFLPTNPSPDEEDYN